MNAQWLEVLSGIDKMVLGSIVGSIVLAFILLVVVFSVKIKSQQDKIVILKNGIKEKIEEADQHSETITKLKENEKKNKKKIDEYKKSEEDLKKEISTLKDTGKRSSAEIKELKATIAKLKKEKSVITDGARKIQDELDSIQNEIEDSHKRNEFWIAQLSELRTKHEALKHKLRTLEGKNS